MKTIIMNQDIHTPTFIEADASNEIDKNRQPPTSPKQVRHFGWTRFIELAVLLSIVIGAVYLTPKMVTPQVVTAVSIILSFLILRFIVRVILQMTFTILCWLFWLVVIVATLFCMLRTHKERYSSIHSSLWVIILCKIATFFIFHTGVALSLLTSIYSTLMCHKSVLISLYSQR